MASSDRPWSWHLQRSVSIVLAVLVPVWFAGWFVVPDYGSLSVVELRERWSSPVWLVLDGTVLLFGFLHGAWGLQAIGRSRWRAERAQRIADAVIWASSAALVVLVLWTFASFDV